MPREDRRISFDNEEVYKAVFALCTQKQLKKPIPGRIVKVTETAGEGPITIDFENPLEKNVNAKEEYTRDFIAAALMLFCRGCGIPLPKSARKSVMLVDGVVILRVQI
jgi:hypothetical protein